MNNYIITQQDYLDYFDGNTTVQRVKDLEVQIAYRISEILNNSFPTRGLVWVYGNDFEKYPTNFSDAATKEGHIVRICGGISGLPDDWDSNASWFKTSWLWSLDYDEDIKKELEKHARIVQEKKDRAKAKRQRQRDNHRAWASKRGEMWTSITSKLTDEEMLYIVRK